MKAVIISIQPKWCELIVNGGKTIEVRKTKPKIDVPFKCYIYETKGYKLITIGSYNKRREGEVVRVKGIGKVIGEFVCDNIDIVPKHRHCDCNPFDSTADCEICKPRKELCNKSCLFGQEIIDYLGYDAIGYAWHISDLVIYDKPKELSEFVKAKIICYGHEVIDCYGCSALKTCKNRCLQRPPQSWQYVEELI